MDILDTEQGDQESRKTFQKPSPKSQRQKAGGRDPHNLVRTFLTRGHDDDDARPSQRPTFSYTLLPVRTVEEFPFHEVPQNSKVVRFRSEKGILLEASYLEDELAFLKRRFGGELQGLNQTGCSVQEQKDVTAQVTDDGPDSGKRKMSVLFAGTVDEVGIAEAMADRASAYYRTDVKVDRPRQKDSSNLLPGRPPLMGNTEVPGYFRTKPVQTAAELPYHRILPGLVAIRYRSDHGLLLEETLSIDDLTTLKKQFGDRLEKISSLSGARVELQDVTARTADEAPGDSLGASILYTGTFQEVANARNLKLSCSAHPREDDLGFTEKASTQKGSIVSQLARPSSSLTPYTHVYRRSPNHDGNQDAILLELSVPEKDFMKFVTRHTLSSAGQEHNVVIEIGEPQQRPLNTFSESTGFARSFMISGNVSDVGRARPWLEAILKKDSEEPNTPSPVHGKPETGVVPKAADASVRTRPDQTVDTSAKIEIACARQTNNERIVDASPNPQDTNITPKDASFAWSTDSEVAQVVSEQMRTELRKLTYPVALIHTVDTRPETLKGLQEPTSNKMPLKLRRGVTVSSFNTVTFHPRVVISFNLKTPSRTWDVIRETGFFRAELLAATPRGAAVAHTFTKPYDEAHEGFEHIWKMGIRAQFRQKEFRKRLEDRAGHSFVFSASARVLVNKTVEVGDHVVIFAEVTGCDHDPTMDPVLREVALSYSNQNYQGPAGPITPDYTPQSVRVLDPLALGVPTKLGGTTSHTKSAVEAQAPTDDAAVPADTGRYTMSRPDPSPGEDLAFDALNFVKGEFNAMRREEEEEEEKDAFAKFSEAEDGAPTAGLTQKSERPEPRRKQGSSVDTAAASDKNLTDSAQIAAECIAALKRKRPRSPAKGVPTKAGSTRGSTRRSPPGAASSSYRIKSLALTGRRSISTTSFKRPAGPPGNLDDVLDPSIRTTAVSDYFSRPDKPQDRKATKYDFYIKQRSVKGAIRLQREAAAMRAQLTNPEERSLLSEEQITALEREAHMKERTVAKKLSWNATAHLRLMLDKGRYDTLFWQRVPFLEGCVEKGQAVLLEEAQDLRRFAGEGKINREKFEEVKKLIEEENVYMSTELMRLRQVVEEEGLDE